MSSSIEERLSREVLRKLRLVRIIQVEARDALCCSECRAQACHGRL